jgi:hypothetical protein
MSYMDMSNLFMSFGVRVDMIMTLIKLGLHDGKHEEVLDL